MKICFISNLYPPYNRGGAEQVVKNTVEGLTAGGHQVVVITACPFNAAKFSIFNLQFSNKSQILNPKFQNPEFIISHPAFHIYRFFPFNFFFYGNDYKYPAWLRCLWHFFDVFNLHSYFVARKILKKEKPDVVHTHNLKGLGYLIPRAIRGLGLRHVHTLHDVQLVEPSGIIIKGGRNKWPDNLFLRRWYERICRYLFGSPGVVISPSNFLMEFYEKRGFFPKSKKVVVPNPVMEIANREPRFVNHEKFRFLYLGQIEGHKGILFLIKAFKKLVIEDSSTSLGMAKKAALHIVGSGSKFKQASDLARGCPQIIFHGKLDHGELPRIFSQTNLTVVPSLCYENSPTVIFESFSYGVPVLASAIEGVAELIKNKENGLTFEAGKEDSLIAQMRWAIENSLAIENMRPAALKSIEGRGLEAYLDKLLNLCYNSLLA